MFHKFVVALFALVFLGGSDLSDVTGRVKQVNADKKILTIQLGGQDKEYKIEDTVKIVDLGGKEIRDRLKARVFKEKGVRVVITTIQKDGVTVPTKIKVVPPEKKD